MLFNKAKTTLIQYPKAKSGTSYIIPSTVTSIYVQAFDGCTALTNISIPNGVQTIGNYAFGSCTGLTSIIIPASVTSIGEGSFSFCSNLANIYVLRSTPPTLGDHVFDGCNNFDKIYVPSSYSYLNTNWPGSKLEELNGNGNCGTTGHEADVFWFIANSTLTIAGSGAMTDYASTSARPWYSNRSNITSVVINEGVTTIGKYAFYDFDNASFTSVNIPASVTTFGKYAFSDCSKLATVSITAGSQLATIDQCAFQYCSSLTSINIPACVTSIWGWTFQGCAFTTFTVPSTVTTLGSGVFENCTALQSVTLENSQESLQNQTFKGCTSLTTVNGLGNFTKIGSRAFEGCTSLTSITIPECIITINNDAFNGSGLTSVHIPANVGNNNGEIGYGAFANCTNLTSITVEAGNTHYKGVDDVLFTYDGTKLMAYPAGKTATSYAIPASVQTIEKYTFWGCSNLTSVTIPSSVQTIDQYAFRSCSNLTSATIYAPSLTTYGSDAFYGNANGRKIYVFNDCVDTYKQATNWNTYANDIEAIKLTVNAADNTDASKGKWCTYYNGMADVTVPNTTTVYTGKVEDGSLKLTETGSPIIKKGEAVILKSDADITLSSAASSGSGDYTGNELQGVDVVTATPENCYTLSRGSDATGPIGFYKYSGATVAANKAYLIYTGSSLARGYIDFGEEDLTGIEAPTTVSDVEDGEVYDLMGRRVIGKPNKKGIYVRNGKKFIVK